MVAMQRRTILTQLVFLDPEKPHSHSQTTAQQAGNCYQHYHGASFLDFKLKGFWIWPFRRTESSPATHMPPAPGTWSRWAVALSFWTFLWGDSLGPKAFETSFFKMQKQYAFLQLTLRMKRGTESCIKTALLLGNACVGIRITTLLKT